MDCVGFHGYPLLIISNLFSIKDGPAIIINGTDSNIAWGNKPLWDITECIDCPMDKSNGMLNFSIYSLDEDITISTRYHGNLIPWDIYSDSFIYSNNESNVSISWDLEHNEEVYLMAWLDYNSNNLEIHLTAWSGVN